MEETVPQMPSTDGFEVSYEAEGNPIVGFLFGGFGCVLSLAILAAFIYLLYLLYSAQQKVPAEHRKMDPPMIWLVLVPLFGIVWNFFVAIRVSDSFKSYFASIGRPEVGETEKMIGLGWAIAVACCVIPCVNLLALPVALVLMVLFVLKINTLAKQLPGGPAAGTTPML